MSVQLQEQQLQQQQYIKYKSRIAQLYPALPIINKQIKEYPKPTLKIQLIKNPYNSNKMLFPSLKQLTQSNQIKSNLQTIQYQFQKYYEQNKRIYCKYNNKNYSYMTDGQSEASFFIDKFKIKSNKQSLKSLQDLVPEIYTLPLVNPKNQVKFDSNFESGNLYAVYQKSFSQYDLILQNDVNTKGNTQWFYFSVTNLPKNQEITLNIVNLIKSDSLFNYGMQPVIFSKRKNQKCGEGWIRAGKNISYYRNQIRRQKYQTNYYTLSFTISSKLEGDTLLIAHCFPYTYTMLNNFLNSLSKFTKENTLTRTSIGKSLGNNIIEVLTITNPQQKKKQDNRKIILIIARQHPGQTQGSYVCEGIINQLLQNSKKSQFIKKNYIIKIIPMVNPDGVILGNYRTNLMGYDLNRKWDKYDKQNLFPEITCIKNYISQINKDKRLIFILDLHGHSKKLGSFFYGNPNQKFPESVRAFPYLCSNLNKHISFQDCTFTLEQSKLKTARIYLNNIYEIINVYTFQSSFFGYINENKKIAFRIQQYKNLGKTLCQSLYYFLQNDQYQGKKTKNKYYQCINQLKQNLNLIETGNKLESGSETNPQEFQINERQINIGLKFLQQDLLKQQLKKSFKTTVNKQNISLSISKYGRQRKIKNQSNQNLKANIRFRTNQNSQLQISKKSLNEFSILKVQKQKKDQYSQKKINEETQFQISIQTEPLNQEAWKELQPIHFVFRAEKINFSTNNSIYIDERKTKCQYLKSQEIQKKQFLTPNFVGRAISLNKFIKIKNNSCQTVLSYSYYFNILKSSSIKVIDTIQSKIKQGKKTNKQPINHHKNNNKDAIKQMLQKYYLYMRQRRLKPICFYEKKHQEWIDRQKNNENEVIPKSIKVYRRQFIPTQISDSGKSINYFFKQF